MSSLGTFDVEPAGMNSDTCQDFWPDLRVDVVMLDMSRENPNYIGQWHMFLPADVCFVCIHYLHLTLHLIQFP